MKRAACYVVGAGAVAMAVCGLALLIGSTVAGNIVAGWAK
jgi:hypothetical protein